MRRLETFWSLSNQSRACGSIAPRATTELVARLGRPDLWLTLDIGHLQCQGELPIGQLLRQWQHALVNIHLEDMCRGRHEHLFFGEGEINFEEVFCVLKRHPVFRDPYTSS